MLVAGYTNSTQLTGIPSDTLQPSNQGGYEAMLYQIDPAAAAGQTLKFGTFLGGGSTDIATGVASDAAGAIYLSGYTMSDNFPVAGDSYQGGLNSASNLFVAKIDPPCRGWTDWSTAPIWAAAAWMWRPPCGSTSPAAFG